MSGATDICEIAATALESVVGDEAQLQRLLLLRAELIAEQASAESPAVARALQMADYHLFLALTYFGYQEMLFPEQR